MSDHHHRVRLSRLRTTSQLLRQTTTSFSSQPLTFLFLTFLLFSFHSLIDHCSLLLTSFVDRDPSLRSLLSRLPLHPPSHAPTRPHHQPRAPFLQPTLPATLGLFSTDEHDSFQSLQSSPYRSPLNTTTVFLSGFGGISGLSRPIDDNGIFIPQVIRSGFVLGQLKDDDGSHINETKFDETEQNRETDDYSGEKKLKGFESLMDLKVVFMGLEFGRQDAAALFYMSSFIFVVYVCVVLGFTIVFSLVLAIIFITVINDFLDRFPSFEAFCNGSRLGFTRVTGFFMMRWVVKDTLTQLLGLSYLGEVKDQYSFFRVLVRLKLTPFTVTPPWIKGFEKEISDFMFAWFILDTLIGLILDVDAFVIIVNPRRRRRQIVKEGLYLISLMLYQAVQLKCLEAILCGSFLRWVLIRILGKSLTGLIESGLEVYFMTAWLVFYLAAKSKGAEAEGRRFGRREMEKMMDGLR